MHRHLTLSMIFLLSAGCLGTDGDGGQFGQEVGARCEVDTTTVLALDEQSPLGFDGQTLVDAAGTGHTDTLVWAIDGSNTGVELTVDTSSTEVRYIEQRMVDSSDGSEGPQPAIEPAMDCPPYIEVDASFTLVTDDGALNEAWDGVLTAYTEGAITARHDLDSPTGSFDAWDHVSDVEDVDEADAWAELTFREGAAEGVIRVQASGVVGDPDDPDSVAFAQNIEAGSFGHEDDAE